MKENVPLGHKTKKELIDQKISLIKKRH